MMVSIFLIPIGAETENSVEEVITDYEISLEDDFADDRIIIVMNNKTSLELIDYSPKDFSEVKCKNVKDFSSSKKEKAKQQLEKINNAFKNRTLIDEGSIVSYKEYNQVICLELEESGKDKVLSAIQILKQRSDVVYAGPDYAISLNSAPNDPGYNLQSQYANMIQLEEAWDITTGSSSVVVGVIDSGIMGNHPDLINRVDTALSRDFTSGAPQTVTQVIDQNGHGTHVAGIIGAQGNNSTSTCGVCWDVTLVSLKCAYDSGIAYSSFVYAAINYAELMDIPLLNISMGWSTYDMPTYNKYYNKDLLAILRNYTGLVVCAAGNDGTDNDVYAVHPANYNSLPNVISVGASDIYDQRWTTSIVDQNGNAKGSNYGSRTVDVFAPGMGVWSTDNVNDRSYFNATSASAPFVTGVAALMLANNPNLKPYEIKCLIMRNVDYCDGAFEDLCVSGGRINAYKALTATVEHEYECIYTYGSGDSHGHVSQCKYCKVGCTTLDDIEEEYSYVNTGNASTHRETCNTCGYIYYAPHTFNAYVNLGALLGHNTICGKCGYSYTEDHSWTTYGDVTMCRYCGARRSLDPGFEIMSGKDEEETE